MTLSKNIYATIPADDFSTIKMSEVSDVVYNRIRSKFRVVLGDKADKLLNKYADRKLKDVVVCQCVDLSDCFTIVS